MLTQKILSLLSGDSKVASVSLIFAPKEGGLSCSLIPKIRELEVQPKSGESKSKEPKIRSFVFSGSAEEVDAGLSKAVEQQLVASIEKSNAVAVAERKAEAAIEEAKKAEEAAKKRTAEAKKQGKSVDSAVLNELKAQVEELQKANEAKDKQIQNLREPSLFSAEA